MVATEKTSKPWEPSPYCKTRVNGPGRRDTADTMERFAAATALNQKYDIDHAQLIGRGKLSVVHRARR